MNRLYFTTDPGNKGRLFLVRPCFSSARQALEKMKRFLIDPETGESNTLQPRFTIIAFAGEFDTVVGKCGRYGPGKFFSPSKQIE